MAKNKKDKKIPIPKITIDSTHQQLLGGPAVKELPAPTNDETTKVQNKSGKTASPRVEVRDVENVMPGNVLEFGNLAAEKYGIGKMTGSARAQALSQIEREFNPTTEKPQRHVSGDEDDFDIEAYEEHNRNLGSPYDYLDYDYLTKISKSATGQDRYDINLARLRAANSQQRSDWRKELLTDNEHMKVQMDVIARQELSGKPLNNGQIKLYQDLKERYAYNDAVLKELGDFDDAEEEQMSYEDELIRYGNKAIEYGGNKEYVPTERKNTQYDYINMYNRGELSESDVQSGLIKPEYTVLTPMEFNILNSLPETDREGYLSSIESELQKRLAEKEAAEAAEYAKEHPISAGLDSVTQGFFWGIPAAIDNFIEGKTGDVDTYDMSSRAIRKADTYRSVGSRTMREKHGDVAGVAYDAGLILLDVGINVLASKTAAALLGAFGIASGKASKIASSVASASMSGRAASSTMISIADRGGSDFQIVTGGLASGLAEFIFEKYSLDKLLSTRSAVGVGNIIKSIATQSAIEESEEIFTEAANMVTDAIIMQGKSESEIRRRELMLNYGLPAKEAVKQVVHENIMQIAKTGGMGALAGGIMGGGAIVAANASHASYMKRAGEHLTQSPETMNRVLQIGIENNNTEANRTAQMIADGMTINPGEAGKMMESVLAQSMEKNGGLINIMRSIQAIEGRGANYIGSEEAIDTAKAVMRMTEGKITNAERATLQKSRGAVTLLTAIEGHNAAWESVKKAAGEQLRVRSEETQMSYGNINDDGDASTQKTEVYSQGERVTIPENSRIVKNVVLDEESMKVRRRDTQAYKNVEMLAQDLGMRVKYVNNLTDSAGTALDGVIISQGIFINSEAKNPSRFVATHEFSHRMKQVSAEQWQKYESFVIKKLQKDGRYENIFKGKAAAYKNSNTDYINEEIAADYIGELFENETELAEFIKESRRDAVTIRDIWYGILGKLGLLDEKKKAQLMWRNAYKAAMKNKDAEFKDAPKFKIITMSDGSGRKYVHATQKVIKSKNPDMWESEIMDYVNLVVRKGEDVIIPLDNEESIVITGRTAWKLSDKGEMPNKYYFVKGNAAGVIDEIVEVSKSIDSSPPYKEHADGFAKYGFDYRKAYFMDIDGKYYELTISVGINQEGKEAYNIGYVKRMTFPVTGSKARGSKPYGKSSSTPMVSQDNPGVNTNSMRNGENNAKKSVSGARISDIEAENAELRKQIENMSLFNISKSAQYGAEIRRAAMDFKSGYGSKMNVSEIQKELSELYNYMIGKDTRNNSEVLRQIHNLAERVIARATETVTDEEHGELLQRINAVRIHVPESERAGFRDGYEYFRKHYAMGKITLANDGIELDVLWNELCNEYPTLFDENMNGSEERLERILEIREEIMPAEESIYKTSEEYRAAVLALENDIMESFYKIPQSDGGNKFVFYGKNAPMAQKALMESKERTTAKKLSWNKNEVKKKIDSDYRYLYQMVNNPTDTRHVPEDMRAGVAYLLDCFKFETVQLDRIKAEGKEAESPTAVRLKKMYDAYHDIIRRAWGIDTKNTENNLLDEHLSEELQALRDEIPVDESGEFKRIQDMSIEELRSISKVLTAVHHSITQRNKAFNSAIKEEISELGTNTVLDMQSIRSKRKGSGERLDYDGIIKAFDKYLNFDNVQPWDFFHQIGGTMERLYMEERKAFNRHIENIREASGVLQSATKGLNLKKLTGKHAEKAWFKFSSGEEILLTKGQILSLYALYQRKQGKEHILGGGIVTNAEYKNERGYKASANSVHRVNEADMGQIFETLSEEEKRMVSKVVDFLSKRCAAWGNETSMRLYGYEKFGEGWYFPIDVSKQTLNTYYGEHGEGNIRSHGSAKRTTPHAKNAIEIRDFFNVVTGHVNWVSLYNTVALPMLDLERVLNFSHSPADNKVRQEIVTTFGKAAEEYIGTFHKDVNGSRKTADKDKILEKLSSNAKKASIGLNARVLLQQPTSISRILLFMDIKDIPAVWDLKALKKEMQENIPIAYWKSLGFRDIGTGSTMKKVLLDNESLYNKAAMGGYGMADDFTWSLIYAAVKNETARKNPSLDKNSTEFMEKVRERFDYVVDRSQVVDSVFHRTQIMRSGNAYTKTATMFMSEPLKTYNMYRTEMLDAVKNGEVGKKAARATAVFVVSNLLLSLAQAIPDTWRENDEKELFKDGKEVAVWKRFLKNIGENMIDNSNPLTYLPYIKDVWSIIQGYSQERIEYSGISDFAAAYKGMKNDKKTLPMRWVDLLKPASALLGMSYGNLYRDATSLIRTVYTAYGDEYADYAVTKFRYDVKNKANKGRFMKYYKRAVENGHSEDAATILADYMAETFEGQSFKNKHAEKVIGEMSKLYGKTEQDSKLFYDLPNREFSVDGDKTSIPDSEYPEYVSGAYGILWDTAYEMVTSAEYKKLSDEDKVRSFGEIKEYAQEAQRMENVDGYELSGWQEAVYSGEIDFIDSVMARIENREYQKMRNDYKDNFVYDESEFSAAELSVIEKVESDAATYYASLEKEREYNEKDLRHIKVYDEKLSEEMPIEEYAGIRAYAKKTAALKQGSSSMDSEELYMYLESTDYSHGVKAALYEAIGNKGWRNKYTGKKIGE